MMEEHLEKTAQYYRTRKIQSFRLYANYFEWGKIR